MASSSLPREASGKQEHLPLRQIFPIFAAETNTDFFMDTSPLTLEKKPRRFLPQDFTVISWEQIKPFYEGLLNRKISSTEELIDWFQDRSELESVLSEDMGWRYINMTTDTTSEEYRERFHFFISQIEPHIAPYTNKLNLKIIGSPLLEAISKEPGYEIMLRTIKKDLEIFREENIPLNTEIQQLSQEYGAIYGDMTVSIDGKELTLPQAGVLLQSNDRKEREEVYKKISERRLEDKDKLNQLFTDLVRLRNQVAINAGFDNYRDYMFTALGRFDYTPEDCFRFHHAVEEEIVPIVR